MLSPQSQRPLIDDSLSAFTEVQNVLQRFVSVQGSAAPMYKKNIGLALLELTFKLPPSLLPPALDSNRPSSRVVQLYLFIEQNLLQRSTFDDIKEYVADLTFDEAKYFIDNFSKIASGKVSFTIFFKKAQLIDAPCTGLKRAETTCRPRS